jgi:hypothetical protein
MTDMQTIKEEFRNKILDFLKKNKESSITHISKELKIGYYLLSFKILPEMIKEKQIELFRKESAFYTYVRLK